MKTLAVIPAYNAESTIGEVCGGVAEYIDHILVVDDGSHDATSKAAGAVVESIVHPENRGKGEALKTGFEYAVERGYSAVLTIDADGQHEPRYIPDFFNRYNKTKADLIIGSRCKNKADMSWDRRFSNFMTSHFLSLMLKTKIEDSQCGYRLIKTDLLREITLNSSRFELETEIIIKAVLTGYRLAFVPITVNYGRGFPSSIKRWSDTWRWLNMVMENI